MAASWRVSLRSTLVSNEGCCRSFAFAFVVRLFFLCQISLCAPLTFFNILPALARISLSLHQLRSWNRYQSRVLDNSCIWKQSPPTSCLFLYSVGFVFHNRASTNSKVYPLLCAPPPLPLPPLFALPPPSTVCKCSPSDLMSPMYKCVIVSKARSGWCGPWNPSVLSPTIAQQREKQTNKQTNCDKVNEGDE